MTSIQVAEKTGLHLRTIKKYAERGWLPAKKVKGYGRYGFAYDFSDAAVEQALRIYNRNLRDHTRYNKDRPFRGI